MSSCIAWAFLQAYHRLFYLILLLLYIHTHSLLSYILLYSFALPPFFSLSHSFFAISYPPILPQSRLDGSPTLYAVIKLEIRPTTFFFFLFRSLIRLWRNVRAEDREKLTINTDNCPKSNIYIKINADVRSKCPKHMYIFMTHIIILLPENNSFHHLYR